METGTSDIGYEAVADWLRSSESGVDAPLEQDWDLIVADGLPGDFPGHIAFYLHEAIPNPARRAYLLNALYVMAWTRFRRMRTPGPDREAARASLQAGLDAAKASGREELQRWAEAVEKQLPSRWGLKYKFWCDGGWKP